ncbi:MAG: class I SAM-dependent methyltransferase [Chloroflexi bacterium]|nr:class I SAM-dependent methyltransferase [Chloroflexota bacterium]
MNPSETARSLFSGIAASYDTPAQLFSFFQYRRWHRFLLQRLPTARPEPVEGRAHAYRVLDMATGTGAVALRLAGRPGVSVVAADVTRPMLAQARLGASRNGKYPTDFVECTAEAVPFPDASFDAVVFTYLLRYVSDVPAILRELARVLRPGGTMASLDFAVPRGPAYPLWRLHTDVVLPLGGALLSPAWGRVGGFLGPSIRHFYRRWPEDRLLELWHETGFPDVEAKRLSLGGALVMWARKSP